MSIPAIRKKLKQSAQKAPQQAQGYIKTLDIQLCSFSRANEDDKAALRPVIEQSCRGIERAARDGR